MKLLKNLTKISTGIAIATICLNIAIAPVFSRETCLIWQAQGSECDPGNVETTLRARGQVQIISPNHGNVLKNFTITIYNPNNSVGSVIINQNDSILLEKELIPGMNEFDIYAETGKVRVKVKHKSFDLSTSLLVMDKLELPITNPTTLIENIVNAEFMIQSEFLGEAYDLLNRMKIEFPDSYEVWAALALCHQRLGNEQLMREAIVKAILGLESPTNEQLEAIIGII